MSPARPRPGFLLSALLAAAAAAVAFRLWASLCFFPLAEWNNLRLAPTFMLAHGPTPYPAADAGPVTTWIYGPVTLLANLPAVAAPDAVAALLVAGVMTAALGVVPASLAVWAGARGRQDLTNVDLAAATLLSLALWPNTSLQYIQSDNTALAFGLVSNLLLVRSRAGARGTLPAAAACAALAVWSKQTAIGLVAGQVLWLAVAAGPGRAARYAALVAAAGLGLGAVFAAWFGFDGLWFNLVVVPGGLPFAPDLAARAREFSMPLALYAGLPAVALAAARREVWRRDSPWLLPALSWLGLLPFGLLSAFKIGGAPNSLNGVLYLVPPAAVAVAAHAIRFGPRGPAWVALATLAVAVQQLASAPVLPVNPLGAQLAQADELARAHPRRLHFPWHPLVTFYAEGRFDHVEDGLATREAAGFPTDPALVRRHLPPEWSMTAVSPWRESARSVSGRLMPPGARPVALGKWSVFAWPAP